MAAHVKSIERVGLGLGNPTGKITVFFLLEGELGQTSFLLITQYHRDTILLRRPDTEMYTALGQLLRTDSLASTDWATRKFIIVHHGW